MYFLNIFLLIVFIGFFGGFICLIIFLNVLIIKGVCLLLFLIIFLGLYKVCDGLEIIFILCFFLRIVIVIFFRCLNGLVLYLNVSFEIFYF